MADFTYKYYSCKHCIREKDHIICKRDGSICKRGCPCGHWELSWWQKLKKKIFGD